MGAPLSDITIYFEGASLIKQTGSGLHRQKANYITDLYHVYLNGYKPTKTSRICLHFKSPHEAINKPSHYGSILECGVLFDESEYFSRPEEEQSAMLLNTMHEAIMGLAEHFSWDRSVFSEAYAKCLENNFRLIKEYPAKKSRDRSVSASVVIEKDATTTFTYIKLISGSGIDKHKVFETVNYNCFDPMYSIAKKAKWIDSDGFGFSFGSGELKIYCSIKDAGIVTSVDTNILPFDEIVREYRLLIKATKEKTNFDSMLEALLFAYAKMSEEVRAIEKENFINMINQSHDELKQDSIDRINELL